MEERWLPVTLNNDYEVSDLGNVRRRTPGRGARAGRMMHPSDDGSGYLDVSLPPRTCKVARIVALAFLGPRPNGMEIDHINGDKHDNRAVNLEYVSRLENMRRHFNSARGEVTRQNQIAAANTPEGISAKRRAGALGGGSNRNTAVTEEQVRALNESGMSGAAIARHMGVGYNIIRQRLGRR